jgi:LmbE family N-acetylglucosaminyl deacetylase
MLKIMVFAPHPDDDIIACGGSMAKYIKQGNQVQVVYLTSGEAGSHKYSKDQLAAIREEEARQAAASLGIKQLSFLRMPDGYISYTQENLLALVNIIREGTPSLIYVPHAQDAVRDHKFTWQLVSEACNKAAGPWFQVCPAPPWSTPGILAYEVWTPLQEPSYIEDISPFMADKLRALRCHQSQLEIQYDEAVTGLNRYRGVMSGQGQYCEAFKVIKMGGPLC